MSEAAAFAAEMERRGMWLRDREVFLGPPPTIVCDVCGSAFQGPHIVITEADHYGDPMRVTNACNTVCARRATRKPPFPTSIT